MLALAESIVPVFALVLMGAGARKWKLLRPPALRGLNDFVFYLALPCLLFGSVAEGGGLGVLDVAFVYFAGALLVFLLGILLSRLLLGAGLAAGTITGLNACYGNTVMLGIPVVGAALGQAGVAILLPIVALHSILLLPLATVLIELDGQAGTRDGASAPPRSGAVRRALRALRGTVPSVARNPIIISILLAFLWRLLGLPVPGILHRLLGLLGACGPTLALFCLGATLPGAPVRAAAREAVLSTAVKLLLMPALVWALCRLAGFAPLPTAVAVLTAGMPTGANAFLLARRAAVLAEASAATVALGTALSLGSLAALLLLLGVAK